MGSGAGALGIRYRAHFRSSRVFPHRGPRIPGLRSLWNVHEPDSDVKHVANRNAITHLSAVDGGTSLHLDVRPPVDGLRSAHAHTAFGNVANPHVPLIGRRRA